MGEAVHKSDDKEELPLSKAAQYLLEECRMVLPGLQALFGFQLIVVFSDGFSQKLQRSEHFIHFAAITLVAIAVALIMTPAALHRATGARLVTSFFLRTSAGLLFWSMPLLAIAICLDFYLIARVIIGNAWAALPACALFTVFVVLWFVLPRARRLQRLVHLNSKTADD